MTIIKKEVTVDGKEANEFTFMTEEEEVENGNVEIEKTVETLPDGSEKTVIKKTIIKPAPNKAFLGVALNSNGKEGALIDKTFEGTPAEKAGLKAGDLITHINDEKINNISDLSSALAPFKSDDEITVTFKRGNKNNQVQVKLATNGSDETKNVWKTKDGEVIELKEGQKMNFIKKDK